VTVTFRAKTHLLRSQIAVMISTLPIMCMALGCSSSLSRREAGHQIDAMMKPHPLGPKKVMSHEVPGFRLADEERESPTYWLHLDEHKEYGNLSPARDKQHMTS